MASGGGRRQQRRVATATGGPGVAAAPDSSDSDGETEPAKSFHRRLSTNRDISSSASIKEGYLLKQTWSFQRWRRRYFKLKGRKLYYAKDTKHDLDTVVNEWNSHRISISRNATACRGRPFMMYHMPEGYDAEEYLCAVSNEDIQACNEECIFADKECVCDEDVFELAELIMEEKGLTFETDVHRAIDLYVALRNEFIRLL